MAPLAAYLLGAKDPFAGSDDDHKPCAFSGTIMKVKWANALRGWNLAGRLLTIKWRSH
jgi:hypothetical protein